MNINDRISILIERLNIKQKDFADRINLKSNTLSMIKSNKRSVTERVINDIVREFNVNKEWLINGTGEIFIQKSTDYIDLLIKEYNLNSKDKEILESYLNMSEENRNLFFNFVQSFNTKK